MSVTERVRGIASRALARFPDYELDDVHVTGSGHARVVSVTLDKPGGVTLDDCALASEAISCALDADDPIAGQYRLEVASPGLERPLHTPEQFARAVGSDVKVKVAQQEPIVGSLCAADAAGIVVATADGRETEIPYADVVRARTVLLGWDPSARKPARQGAKAGRKKTRGTHVAAAAPDEQGKS